MRTFNTKCFTLILARLLSTVCFTSTLNAATLKPVVADLKGKVMGYSTSGAETILAKKSPISLGSTVKTDKSAAALIVIAPGQSIYLEELTSVQLVKSETKLGDKLNSGVAKLISGTVQCHVEHPDNVKQSMELEVPGGSLKAKGTFWNCNVDSTTHQMTASVASGNVKVSYLNNSFDLAPGMVMTAVYNADMNSVSEVTVVNLIDGTSTTYTPNAPPKTQKATIAQLNAAKSEFNSLLAKADNLQGEEKSSLEKLLAKINKVLTENSIGALALSGGGGGGSRPNERLGQATTVKQQGINVSPEAP
jgi:hypothetical protein